VGRRTSATDRRGATYRQILTRPGGPAPGRTTVTLHPRPDAAGSDAPDERHDQQADAGRGRAPGPAQTHPGTM